MFSFFKRKNIISDIEWLGVDVHSHLLPGIDDGAKDIDQSLRYIKSLNELGFSKLICTPHIYKELYPNTPQSILPVLEKVQLEITRSALDVEIAAAAEYMTDSDFSVGEGMMTLPGNYILIEMSYLSESPNIDSLIFELQIKGYKVILAHPERYCFYHKDAEKLIKFKEQGVLLQLNLLAVTGYYGKHVKLSADYLLENKLYDLAATDLHHDKHLKILSSVIEDGSLYAKIGQYNFLNKELFLQKETVGINI